MKCYFMKKCDGQKNGKHFWNAIRPFMTNKGTCFSNTITLYEDNDIISNPSEVSEVFNKFFSSIADTIGGTDDMPYEVDQVSDLDIPSVKNCVERHMSHPSMTSIYSYANGVNEFKFSPMSVKDVEQVILKLNVCKATGPDSIPGKALKTVSAEISPILSKLFNECIKCKIYPDELKKADVSPVFKKLDLLCKNNYRPINVISIISKIVETHLGQQLGCHFDPVFNDFLTAYRKHHSCENALLSLTEKWRKALDDKCYVGALLMDLSKAFDCLPHALLIAKLRAYNVSEDACCLIASYLSRRLQRVKVADIKSTWCETKKGVPQGSGLGPLLFNIFINDIFHTVKQCNLVNYADDNTIFAISTDHEQVVQALQADAKKSN